MVSQQPLCESLQRPQHHYSPQNEAQPLPRNGLETLRNQLKILNTPNIRSEGDRNTPPGLRTAEIHSEPAQNGVRHSTEGRDTQRTPETVCNRSELTQNGVEPLRIHSKWRRNTQKGRKAQNEIRMASGPSQYWLKVT
jgi:hypothetical protein